MTYGADTYGNFSVLFFFSFFSAPLPLKPSHYLKTSPPLLKPLQFFLRLSLTLLRQSLPLFKPAHTLWGPPTPSEAPTTPSESPIHPLRPSPLFLKLKLYHSTHYPGGNIWTMGFRRGHEDLRGYGSTLARVVSASEGIVRALEGLGGPQGVWEGIKRG